MIHQFWLCQMLARPINYLEILYCPVFSILSLSFKFTSVLVHQRALNTSCIIPFHCESWEMTPWRILCRICCSGKVCFSASPAETRGSSGAAGDWTAGWRHAHSLARGTCKAFHLEKQENWHCQSSWLLWQGQARGYPVTCPWLWQQSY